MVNKQFYHFFCLPFRLATSPREFTQFFRPVVALLRQGGVKLHVYLDVWQIRADTPVRPNCMPRWPSVCSSFSAGSSTTRSQTCSLQVRISSSSGCSSTLDSSQWCPYRRCVSKSSPFTNTGWPTQSSQPAQITGHAGVYGFTGTTGKTPSSSCPLVGRHSMVPEDRQLDWPDHSSSVGAVRDGPVGISSSPARSFPHYQRDGSDFLHGCVQFELGSPVRLTLDTGTVVSISKIVAHQRSGDAGHHQRCERLPTSSEVSGGLLDVRQCSDCGLHQEWGRHTIKHSNADDDTPT